MKITELSIVFVLIFFPFFWIVSQNSRELQEAQNLSNKYETALRTAVMDAGTVMHQNEKQSSEAGYGSSKFVNADKDLALETFTQTLALNLGIQNDPAAIRSLFEYIPAIFVLDYDGYYMYAKESELMGQSENSLRHVWSPKKPYTYADEDGNSINFTLDDYVYAYDAEQQLWLEGFQDELIATTQIPLLKNDEYFEQVRRSRIVNVVQQDLAEVINRHNEFARRNGISYTFTLPLISQEDWYNSINDTGMIAFIQGISTGSQKINNYAIGGGRLIKKAAVIGGVDPDSGIKYYYPATCSNEYRPEEVFTDAQEAAAQGYFEQNCYINH